MRHIGIDLRCLPEDGSPGAGVAHAGRELARELVTLGEDVTWHVYLPRGARIGLTPAASVKVHFLKGRSGIALRRSLKQHPCEIILAVSGAVPPRLKIPVVPWVHDAAIFDHPEWFSQSFIRRTLTTGLFRWGVQHAPRVLAVSQNTKDELVRLFHLDPSQVMVTQEGGDTKLAQLDGQVLPEAKKAARERVSRLGLGRPFALCLGTVEPRKNLVMAVRAWLQSGVSEALDLVIAGRDGWKIAPIRQVFEQAKKMTEARLSFHRIEEVSDELRRDLLLAADVTLVPSWHEGFGLVALEAMQAGTAVIASSTGALPEVVGEAGGLVAPDNLRAWARGLSGIMEYGEIRQRLAEEGKARSAQFSWKRAAEIAFQALTSSL